MKGWTGSDGRSGSELSATTTTSYAIVISADEDDVGPSDEQLEALEDGVVTFGEYEQAVLAHIGCLAEVGIDASEPSPSNARTLLNWTEVQPAGMPEAEFLRLEGVCLDRHLVLVADKYLEDARPDAATKVEYAELLRQCLNDAGANLEPGLTELEIVPRILSDGADELPQLKSYPCLREYAFHVVVPSSN